MAKTSITDILSKIQRRVDYDITDSDLTNLLLDMINDALKLINQWLIDAQRYIDTISESSSVKTTAAQQYIDISTTLANLDDIIALYEKDTDSYIEMLPPKEFFKRYADETASSSTVPDYATILNNKLFLGPTPSTTDIVLYPIFATIPAEVTSASTMPFKTKYDPLLIAIVRVDFLRWQDASDVTAILSAEKSRDELRHHLITIATTGANKVQQSASRREVPDINPRVPLS